MPRFFSEFYEVQFFWLLNGIFVISSTQYLAWLGWEYKFLNVSILLIYNVFMLSSGKLFNYYFLVWIFLLLLLGDGGLRWGILEILLIVWGCLDVAIRGNIRRGIVYCG